jgi:HK97 family phage prohead protease
MPKLVDQSDFHRLATNGQARGVAVRRTATVKPKAHADGSRKVRFCFSDGSVDRMGDTISPWGWDLSDFKRNPVALWSHDSTAPPIGRASNIAVEGNRLMGDIEFADADTYAFADTVYRLTTAGFISAVSVGFLPVEYTFVENDPDRGFGIDFKKQQLLEISVCPVPANPNALSEARSLGIDMRPVAKWAERAIDRGSRLFSRADLCVLRDAASGSAIVLSDARRARDHARAVAIRLRTSSAVRAPLSLDPAMLAIKRRAATDLHNDVINRRSGACAAMAAWRW